jgi:hypothetical protein
LVSMFLLLVVEVKWRRMVLLKLGEFEENIEVENLVQWRRLVLDLKVKIKARDIADLAYEAIDLILLSCASQSEVKQCNNKSGENRKSVL